MGLHVFPYNDHALANADFQEEIIWKFSQGCKNFTRGGEYYMYR